MDRTLVLYAMECKLLAVEEMRYLLRTSPSTATRLSETSTVGHASLAPHVESTDYVSVVYGELFGGIYPHPDVEDLGFLHVQKGVYYCPGIEFSAFDVCVNIPQSNKQQWMNYDLCQQLFENSGLWYSKPVIRGTLAEVLQYDIKRNSTIPKLLGLPELEQNQMEGIVIKSVEPIYYGRHQLRAMYKMKNIKFQEVNPKPPPTKYERNRDARSEAIVKIYEELARYVMNDNRADGISSKIGRITESNVTEAAEALFNDALKDFLKDSSDLWNSVDTDVQETVQKNMKSAAVTFVNEYILKQ